MDSRQFCGNSVFFHCWDGCGYTLDVRMAAVYTKEKAKAICENRETDKMYKYSDVLKIVQHHIDMQDLRRLKERKNPHTFSHLNVSK